MSYNCPTSDEPWPWIIMKQPWPQPANGQWQMPMTLFPLHSSSHKCKKDRFKFPQTPVTGNVNYHFVYNSGGKLKSSFAILLRYGNTDMQILGTLKNKFQIWQYNDNSCHKTEAWGNIWGAIGWKPMKFAKVWWHEIWSLPIHTFSNLVFSGLV